MLITMLARMVHWLRLRREIRAATADDVYMSRRWMHRFLQSGGRALDIRR